MDSPKFQEIYTKNWTKISPLFEGWHQYIKKIGNFDQNVTRSAGLKKEHWRSQPSMGSRLLEFVYILILMSIGSYS